MKPMLMGAALFVCLMPDVVLAAAPLRPQEAAIAAHPAPHRDEDVRFGNASASVTLAGTFSTPPGAGPFPAVVLVCGSGDNTRDYESDGHKKFVVLADALNRAGIAVLRYDKRGVGQSTGNFDTATTTDLAGDAAAAVAWLKTRADVDRRHIGIIGHSEGGTIAPIVASQDADVSFVVMLSGVAVPFYQDLLFQKTLLARAGGESEGDIARRFAFTGQVYALVRAASSVDEAKARIAALSQKFVADGRIAPAMADDIVAESTTNAWFYAAIRFDPTPALQKVDVPVLAIYGSRDLLVPASMNLPALRDALRNDRDVELVELPGLNHLLQPAVTGLPAEFATIPETVSPEVLKRVTAWVRGQVK